MFKVALFFIVSIGLVAADGTLDVALENFLTLSKQKSFTRTIGDETKNLYELFKMEINRDTTPQNDEKIRFSAFNETLHDIMAHHQQGEKSYTLGLTQFADWTEKELKVLSEGLNTNRDFKVMTDIKDSNVLFNSSEKLGRALSAPPASYDFTAKVIPGTSVPYILAIKNQGQCGSCYAFAFVCLLEYQYAVQFSTSLKLSEQQIVDCDCYDSGCNGGLFTNTFLYFINTAWTEDSDSIYPYKGYKSGCSFKNTGTGIAQFGKLNGYYISPNLPATMQQSLVSYGPLWVGVFVGNASYSSISNTFSYYTGGIIQLSACTASRLVPNHAVVIVGYGVDSVTNVAYWKVRNSWGTSWGENGYFRIKRGVNMCGIESMPYFLSKY